MEVRVFSTAPKKNPAFEPGFLLPIFQSVVSARSGCLLCAMKDAADDDRI
ncbi:MAG: hypothetical protein U5N27_05615 [Rhizobium sp.]|nr:hypothetical protein [Rhizobium sp.]